MIKVGVIGLGYWGPNILRDLMLNKNYSVVAIADIENDRIQKQLNIYPNLISYSKGETLIKEADVDAVFIVIDISKHYNLTKIALENKLHVFCEKPLTIKSQQIVELEKIANHNNLILMVGHTYEYHPVLEKIKKTIEDGNFGKIRDINLLWTVFDDYRFDSDCIWELAPHGLSVLKYFNSLSKIKNSFNLSKCYSRNTLKDKSHIIFEFENKSIAHIHLSWIDRVKQRKVIVNYENATIFYDEGQNYFEFKVLFSDGREDKVYNYDKVVPYPLPIELVDFHSSIKNHTKPKASFKEAFEIVKIIESIKSES